VRSAYVGTRPGGGHRRPAALTVLGVGGGCDPRSGGARGTMGMISAVSDQTDTVASGSECLAMDDRGSLGALVPGRRE